MSELKFTCPACGQHMQCEKAYSGDKTNCPSCNAELRVPFSHTPPEPITMLPRAELVSVAESAKAPIKTKSSEASLSEAAVPISPSASAKDHHAAPHETHEPEEAHCICPVCKSELRIPKDSDSSPAMAEIVSGPRTPEHTPSGHPNESESITEREKHIVAARESNPVSLYPAMKPRLSYILNSGESKAGPGENAKGSAGKEEPPPPTQTVTE